jgi:uncharacterized lipoprotein
MDKLVIVIATLASVLILAGCSTAPTTRGGQIDLKQEAEVAVIVFRQSDSTMRRFFDEAYG